MPLSTGGHWAIVIYSLLAGAILGSLFDFYRAIRGRDTNQVIVIIEDILFWILSALIVFVFLLYNNYAFLGPYVYMFIGAGLVIYLRTLSKYMYALEVKIFFEICRFFRIGYKNVTYPIRIINSKGKKKR